MVIRSWKGWEAMTALPEAVCIQLELVLQELQISKGRLFTVHLLHTHPWKDTSDFGYPEFYKKVAFTMQDQRSTVDTIIIDHWVMMDLDDPHHGEYVQGDKGVRC